MDLSELATSLLAADGDKHGAPSLAVLIVVPLVLAFVLYRFASSRAGRGAPRWQLWASVVPLVVGGLLAVRPLRDVAHESYREFHALTPRSVALHYAAFISPCAGIVLLSGLILYRARRERLES